MTMDSSLIISELVLLGMDDRLSPQQRDWLNDRIVSDPAAAEHYLELIAQHAIWQRSGRRVLGRMRAHRPDNDAIMAQALEEDLETQEEILRRNEIERAQRLRRAVEEAAEDAFLRFQAQERQKQQEELSRQFRRRQRNRLLLIAAVLAIALPTGIFTALNLIHRQPVVAHVAQAANLRWAALYEPLAPGDPVRPGLHRLEAGYLELQFKKGARVGLRGPATFEILNANALTLSSGRVLVRMEDGRNGFTVNTPACRVVDLGTEFGLEVIPDGTSTLHVVEGKVAFNPGYGDDRQPERVLAGRSLEIQRDSRQVTELAYSGRNFADDVKTGAGGPWRGAALDLADLAGQGNGFGTGRLNWGINPLSGQFTDRIAADREGYGRFAHVPASPAIDGVFVPDGDAGPVRISSAGHYFRDCPDTNNIFYTEIINGDCRHLPPAGIPAVLGGLEYGIPERPALLMHANIGITFDLQAIRSQLVDAVPVAFESICGITERLDRSLGNHADFWVLVDGEVRFRLSGAQVGTTSQARVELGQNDRFLTLVTTDGGDPAVETGDPLNPWLRETHFDWCIFGKPKLVLGSKRGASQAER